MAIFDRFNIRLVAAGAGLCVIAIALSPEVAAAPPMAGGNECFEGKGEVCTAIAPLAGMAGIPMALPGPCPRPRPCRWSRRARDPVVPAAPARAGAPGVPAGRTRGGRCRRWLAAPGSPTSLAPEVRGRRLVRRRPERQCPVSRYARSLRCGRRLTLTVDCLCHSTGVGPMRAVVRCVLVAIAVAASVVAVPAGSSLAAANQSPGFAIASVLPTRGEVVGVAHPVVVTFSAPVANRHAAERAIEVKSAPAMTGKFEWLDDDVVQWVPDRFWPAHSTVALSVGSLSTNFATGPAVVGVANISDHTFTVTIDGVEAGPPSALPSPHHRPHWGEPGCSRRRWAGRSTRHRSAPTPCCPRNVRWSWIRAASASPSTLPMVTTSRWITPSGSPAVASSCIQRRGPSIHSGTRMSATAASA